LLAHPLACRLARIGIVAMVFETNASEARERSIGASLLTSKAAPAASGESTLPPAAVSFTSTGVRTPPRTRLASWP